MTTATEPNTNYPSDRAGTDKKAIRGSRLTVPRSRGAVNGLLVLLLGAWAVLVPFIGPYLGFGYGPQPGTAWHWTDGFGWIDVVGGGAAFIGGLLLLGSASRVVTSVGGWLAAAGGAWLVIGPTLSPVIGLGLGGPDFTLSPTVQALERLFYFLAVGGGILLLAAVALGRLSVHSLRDVRAAEKRNAADAQRDYERQRVESAAAGAGRDGAAPASDSDNAERWTPDGHGRHEQSS